MKARISLLLFAAAVLTACNSGSGEKAVSSAEAKGKQMSDAGSMEVAVDLKESKVGWYGSKPGGDHYGEVLLSEGILQMEDGELTGGKFSIDMSTISNQDLENETQNANLVNHLKSPDFFNVDSFPHAQFMITGIAVYEGAPLEDGQMPTHLISGDLTIKEITRNIQFPAMIKAEDGLVRASVPRFFIDRSEWDVRWGSTTIFPNLRERIVHDDIGISIELIASLP